MTSSDPRAKTARKKFGNGIPPVYRIGLEWCSTPCHHSGHIVRRVLDFGCGYARFADEFLKAGACYVATDLERKDFSDQPLFEAELAKTDYQMADYIPAEMLHLCQGYELVMLSNVANVAESTEQLEQVIKEAWRLIDKGGSVLLNYPRSPRKLPLSFAALKNFIYELLDCKVAIIEDYEKDLVLRLYKI